MDLFALQTKLCRTALESTAILCEHMFVPGRSASILHADLDSFYASVEQRDSPQLRGKPVLVGRGVVTAASYEAKARGVRTPMNCGAALKLCPDAIVVDPRMEAYSEASSDVFDIFEDTTPSVEGLSIDEAFLEVGGLERLVGTPLSIATTLRSRVAAEVGLNITVGIARTKFLAKVASGVAKPDGLLLVDPEKELDFLHPLPVQKLWGVGKVTTAKLQDRGLYTVGDVAALPLETVVAVAGTAAGHKLHALAHNRDHRQVERRKRRSSIGSQRALERRPKDRTELNGILGDIVDRVTHRMRLSNRVGRTVVLRFRFDDFSRATRSVTLPTATSQTPDILNACHSLLQTMETTIRNEGLTLLGLSVTNLADSDEMQLSLPFADGTNLDAAIDDVRARFGTASIGRATNVNRQLGPTVPILPDWPSKKSVEDKP